MTAAQFAELMQRLGTGFDGEELKAALRSFERSVYAGRKTHNFQRWITQYFAGTA